MPLWKLTAWPNITGKQITVDITAWCFPSLFPGSAAGIRKVTQKLYRGRIIGLESTKKRKLKENSIKAVGLKANRTEWEEVLPNRANTLPTDCPNSEKWPAQFRNRSHMNAGKVFTMLPWNSTSNRDSAMKPPPRPYPTQSTVKRQMSGLP